MAIEKAEAVSELIAKNIILATGARARTLPGAEPDGKLILTHREATVPDTMPKSLLVIGSGAIGIEFASYKYPGRNVTVAEVMGRILPVEDAEISAFVQKELENQGMTILTSTTVAGLEKGADTVTASVQHGGTTRNITVDRIILVGVVGNVENLGLDDTSQCRRLPYPN